MNRHIESLDLASTAVLAIDFHQENEPGQRWAVERYGSMLSSAASILAAARKSGTHVLHSRTMRRRGARIPELEPRLPDGTLLYGDATSAGAKYTPQLAPFDGEIEIEKTRSSAFADTQLAQILRERRITDLVAAGVWTEECVLLTVKDAISRGFKVWLAAEACASGSFATHQTATAIMAMRLYGGGIVGTVNAVACLQGKSFVAFRPDLPVPLLTNHGGVDQLYRTMIQAD